MAKPLTPKEQQRLQKYRTEWRIASDRQEYERGRYDELNSNPWFLLMKFTLFAMFVIVVAPFAIIHHFMTKK